MENLERIIKGYVDKTNSNNQTKLNYIDAIVLSVNENHLRADVKLITGQEYRGMLNKTGEHLHNGQGVKVGYITVPSKGWIALAYGEADPLGGSGGGDNISVGSAAIVSNANDFIINEEVMIDYSPATRASFGNTPAFIIQQQNYMYFGEASGSGVHIKANNALFGDTTYFKGFYLDDNNIVHSYEVYLEMYVSKREKYQDAKYEYISIWRTNVDSAYLDNNPSSTPTVTITKGCSLNEAWVYDASTSSRNLTDWSSDWMIASRAETLYHKRNLDERIQAFFPDGVDYYFKPRSRCVVNNHGWWFFDELDYFSPNYYDIVSYTFRNRAEQDFALDITQRVEPVVTSP